MRLARKDSRPLTTALDIHRLPFEQALIDRLSYRHQHPIVGADNDLLPGNRALIVFLHLVSDIGATDGSGNHRHVTAGASTDQAADPQTDQSANDRTNAGMLIAGNFNRRNLLDNP